MSNEQDRIRRDAAIELNRKFLESVGRWMLTRAVLSLTFFTAGGLMLIFVWSSFGYFALFAFPLWIVATIFLLMFLDAHQRWREVRARNWVTVTPRIGHVRDTEAKEAPVNRPGG